MRRATLWEIKKRTSIVTLIKEYIPEVAPAGRNYKARCPFHKEKTPSFMVSSEEQTFHCYGCTKEGDAFAFVMERKGLTYKEAAKKLALRVGLKPR